MRVMTQKITDIKNYVDESGVYRKAPELPKRPTKHSILHFNDKRTIGEIIEQENTLD